MAKKKVLKRWWLVYTGKTVEPQLLSFKESEKAKLRHKFYWEEKEPAERFLEYLNSTYD